MATWERASSTWTNEAIYIRRTETRVFESNRLLHLLRDPKIARQKSCDDTLQAPVSRSVHLGLVQLEVGPWGAATIRRARWRWELLASQLPDVCCPYFRRRKTSSDAQITRHCWAAIDVRGRRGCSCPTFERPARKKLTWQQHKCSRSKQ